MRMVQYVIQVQQLGLRVGAQKNRLNGIEVIPFEYLLYLKPKVTLHFELLNISLLFSI